MTSAISNTGQQSACSPVLPGACVPIHEKTDPELVIWLAIKLEKT